MSQSPADWLVRAEGRLPWMLWGKAMASAEARWPAHPLLCHMLDVAAVAAHSLDTLLPPATRRLLLTILPTEESSRALLLFLVAAHDIGKATPTFQRMFEPIARELPSRGLDVPSPRSGARHHGDAGAVMLRDWLARRSADRRSKKKLKDLGRAVAGHHGQFPLDDCLMRPLGPHEGGGPAWISTRKEILDRLASFFQAPETLDTASVSPAQIMSVAGFTSVVDWVGSQQEFFVYEAPPPSLESYWPVALERAAAACEAIGMSSPPPSAPHTFRELFPNYRPWPLHEAADELAAGMRSPSLVIVEAPMGEGKTEAAMVFASHAAARLGQAGLFVGLPTRATANQMFHRMRRFLEATTHGPTQLVLAHAEAPLVPGFREIKLASVHDPRGPEEGSVRAGAWFSTSKRTLLATHAVGTIDQALLSMLRTGHAFVRYFGLARKTVVLDEVHAYDTYTGRLLDRLLEWLAAAGTTVTLLSATLPSARRRQLMRAYHRGLDPSSRSNAVDSDASYPRISIANGGGLLQRSVGIRRAPVSIRLASRPDSIETLVSDVVEEARRGGCIGVICNTVERAQRVYQGIRAEVDADVLLLHSRLFPDERLRREEQLEAWLGPPREDRTRPERCVVVGTQVLEQSLDVDFDLLFTDIAPIDLVLQRAGRLHRHARPNRHPERLLPELRWTRPEGDAISSPIDEVAGVYAELFVRRSIQALDAQAGCLSLPTDIEPLVEDVYRTDPPPEGHPLFDAYLEAMGEASGKLKVAEQRLVPPPDKVCFGELKVFLEDDDDPAMAAVLKAATRDAPPSVTVVCARRDGDRCLVDRAGQSPLPFDPQKPPTPAVLEALVRRSLQLSRQSVVAALESTPAPEGWRRSSLLRHRRLVLFEGDRARVGGSELILHPELGLLYGPADWAEPATTSPSHPRTDDD